MYVDAIIIISSEASDIEHIKSNMSKDFDMTDLGIPHYFLDVKVWQTSNNFFFSQTKHTIKMTYCKIFSTPMEKGLRI
jgi:hypothetical protein